LVYAAIPVMWQTMHGGWPADLARADTVARTLADDAVRRAVSGLAA
jgi:hypothetical protein